VTQSTDQMLASRPSKDIGGTSAASAVRSLIEAVMTRRLLDLSEESSVDRNILNRASRRSNTKVVPFE
jgi:hypothetical protein